MFLCEVCGAVYEWEMYFNNHIRSVHQLKVFNRPRASLTSEQKTFLNAYFIDVCRNPTLDQVKHLASFLDIKKESVYWWFFNQNKKAKREKHGRKTSDKRGTSDVTSHRKKEKRENSERNTKSGAIQLIPDRKEKKRGRISEENSTVEGIDGIKSINK